MKTFLSIAVILLVAGCAGIPSQFSDETPPLSKNDQNIVVAAASVRQDMPEVTIGLETSIPFALSAATKSASSYTHVQTILFEVGTGLTDITGSGSVSPTLISDNASAFNTSLSSGDEAVLQSGVSVAQSAFSGIFAHLNTLANSATNPDVKAYVLATIPIVAQGFGEALVVADEAGAPAKGATVAAFIQARRDSLARASRHAKYLMAIAAQHPAYLQEQMVATTRE